MQRSLPLEEKPPSDRPALRVTLALVSRNRTLLAATALGCGLFFSFVGIFSYAEYRLQRPPFSLGTTASSLIFLLWLFGPSGRSPVAWPSASAGAASRWWPSRARLSAPC